MGTRLHLKGVDAFAPASHIHEEIALAPSLTDPSSLSVIGALLVGGAVAASPSTFSPADMLTPAALALFPEIETRCDADLGKPDSWGGIAPANVIRAGYDKTALYKLLDANDPRVLKITIPVLAQQGKADALVLPSFTDEVVTALRAKGAKVDYRRYAGADHNGVIAAGRTDTRAWFRKILG